MKTFIGISCSNGIAYGWTYIYRRPKTESKQNVIGDSDIEHEIGRLNIAIEKTRNQLTEIKYQVLNKLGKESTEVFNAHLEILNDPVLRKELEEAIEDRKKNACDAITMVFNRHISIFMQFEDEIFREKAADIKDICLRLQDNISGIDPLYEISGCKDKILVTDEISPTDILMIMNGHMKGIVAGKGSNASHAAIMARSLGLPAVFGLGEAISQIYENSSVIVDGYSGTVILDPDNAKRDEFEKIASCHNTSASVNELECYPAITTDGKNVRLLANIDTPGDISVIKKYGAEGVGLYRSELIYSASKSLPDGKTQFETYKEAAEKLSGKPLTIRTLDAGGDKKIPCLNLPEETNPFLGWRSIRISLVRRDIFKTQLKAILKASIFGNVSLMYPMISNISEIREANSILGEVRAELEKEGFVFSKPIRVGLMVEVPSAAIMIDSIIKEVDFVSIGTNDLCQYVLAADRSNPHVSYLHQQLNPAVLRLINSVALSAQINCIPVSVCGEMASDPSAVIILLGMGISEFSMNAAFIPAVKKVISSISFDYAKNAAKKVLELSSVEEVKAFASEIPYKTI